MKKIKKVFCKNCKHFRQEDFHVGGSFIEYCYKRKANFPMEQFNVYKKGCKYYKRSWIRKLFDLS